MTDRTHTQTEVKATVERVVDVQPNAHKWEPEAARAYYHAEVDALVAAKDAEIAKLHAENVVLMGKNAGALDLAVSENARAEKAEAALAAKDAEIARLRKDVCLLHLHVEAMSEIKATIDGSSQQSVHGIVYGLLDEIAALTGEKTNEGK